MGIRSYIEKRAYLLHIAAWLILITMGVSGVPPVIPLTFALPVLLLRFGSMAAVVYLNVLVIIPRFFRKGKFIWYFLVICLLIVLSAIFNGWVGAYIEQPILTELGLDISNLRPEGSPFKGEPTQAARRVASVFITIVFLFVSTVIKLGLEFLKKERLATALQNEKLQTELKFLRAQINPHFLFNALNNLYAINQLYPERAQEFILKLSEMLRYVTYESSKEKVSLAGEINYIKNYLFFQQNKGEENQEISFEIAGDHLDTFFVEPMVLVPFVENCFKHNYSDGSPHRWVSLHLSLTENRLRFLAENNLPEKKVDPLGEDATIGIGIQNVRRRLELLYKDAFRLDFDESEDKFTVELILEKSM